ncbi:hypothetical protein SLA2020_478510 [Shorea laevis]
MPGPTVVIEPVEPQSLKKLSLKSLKRSLDLFSPIHAQFLTPDSESKKIRMSHMINVEYGGIKGTGDLPTRQANSGATDGGNQVSVPSNALALPGHQWTLGMGYADCTIKIWDVASGRLKLTLTGHIEQIRG